LVEHYHGMVGVCGSRPHSSIRVKTALERGFGKVYRLCWNSFRLSYTKLINDPDLLAKVTESIDTRKTTPI
jgi:hypothetical protein